MATNFPSSLDAFTNPTSTDALDSVSVPHASQHSDLNDAVEALEAKVGADGSAVTSSHDYKIAQLPAGQLAIATSTADFTATTSGVDILNVSVTLSSSRILKITYHIGAVTNPSTNLQWVAYIIDGPIATGTQLANTNQSIGTASDANVSWGECVYSATFAAGTHDFYASALTSTGTCIFNGAAARLHTLIVEDLGAG